MIAFVRVALAAGSLVVAAALYGCGGGGGGGTPSTDMRDSSDDLAEFGLTDLGEWEFARDDEAGDVVGVQHPTNGLKVYYEDADTVFAVITDSSPAHQPTITGTWEGQWLGNHEELDVSDSGRAEIDVVVSGNDVQATLTYFDILQVGTVTADPATVVDGRFSPVATVTVDGSSLTYSGEGQFGGPDQDGVVGYVHAPDLSFLSVFYGDRN